MLSGMFKAEYIFFIVYNFTYEST